MRRLLTPLAVFTIWLFLFRLFFPTLGPDIDFAAFGGDLTGHLVRGALALAGAVYLRMNFKALADARLGLLDVILFTAFWWTVVLNAPFFREFARHGAEAGLMTTFTAGAFFAISAAFLTLLSTLPRRFFVALAMIFTFVGTAAFAAAFLYGIALSPDMARNFIETDGREALGYVSLRTTALVLFAALPPVLALLMLRRDESPRRMKKFLGTALAFAGGVLMLFVNLQNFSGAMRADKTLRYRIAPFNAVYATAKTVWADESPSSIKVREAVDPHPVMRDKSEKPLLFVVVVGETARSANWGLAGYERQTTPELAKINGLVSWPASLACGTSTDVSLPCMLSRIGRSDYDRDRILREEPLPDLLQRAGYRVEWIENQSGCKGACDRVPTSRPKPDPEFCNGDVCMDGALVKEARERLSKLRSGEKAVLFLHMMGSHGPAYAERSPKAFKRFGAECTSSDLASCPRETIVNAYDHSILYTDHVLASLIRELEARADVDTALFFASDHGESLGEKGLWLHGAPWWMAPDEQKRVPMLFWMSKGFEERRGVSRQALLAHDPDAVTHESLYSSVLGLLGVETSAYRREYDLSAAKR